MRVTMWVPCVHVLARTAKSSPYPPLLNPPQWFCQLSLFCVRTPIPGDLDWPGEFNCGTGWNATPSVPFHLPTRPLAYGGWNLQSHNDVLQSGQRPGQWQNLIEIDSGKWKKNNSTLLFSFFFLFSYFRNTNTHTHRQLSIWAGTYCHGDLG